MNSIKDLLPGSMRERTFQLKARRDAGAVWNDPQFVECKKCGRRATRQIWNKAQYVCPNCGVHLPIGGYYRLNLILDKGSFRELDADLAPQDVLQFPGYPEKLEAQTGKTGLKEAVITATGRIEGTPVVTVVLDSRFFMGSMSTTVGEKITRAVEHATAKHLPLIIFSASGGAGCRRHFQPDADGKDLCRHRAVLRPGRAVHQRADPPHHRRRDCQLCQPWRYYAGRAGALIGFAGPGSLNRPSAKSCPQASSAASSSTSTALWTR